MKSTKAIAQRLRDFPKVLDLGYALLNYPPEMREEALRVCNCIERAVALASKTKPKRSRRKSRGSR